MLVGPLYGLRLDPMALANCTACAAMNSISPEERGQPPGYPVMAPNRAMTICCPPME